MRVPRSRSRGAAAELLIGACGWILATGLVTQVARSHLEPGEPKEPEPPPAPKGAAPETPHTPAPSEPRPIGAEFDSDAALPSKARSVASYSLEGRLDPDAHEVEGRGTIRWTNAANVGVSELYLHLYLNAFKNTRSLFFRSPFGRSRSGQRTTKWGYIDVRRLTARELGPENLFEKADFVDELGDETDVRVPLPRPVGPGETLVLEVEWTSRLPAIVERTGHAGSFHMVAQWFPKIARLEPNGTFAHFSFHPHAEFYSDFGDYDVTLDVPARMLVGATGERASTRVEGERRIETYRAASVHDFAWTAWDGFEERRATHEGVQVHLLYPRGHDDNAEATLRAARQGLELYGGLFGRYPYRTLTVVHPPVSAGAAGGMEYPTLITTGAPWYGSALFSFVERVTLHELGHQWFYGLVATDEHGAPFLDEGLTSYAEAVAMERLFGAGSGFSLFELSVSGDAYMRAAAATAAHRDVVARPAAAFASFSDLAALVYARTATAFQTLGAVFGEKRVLAAVGRYARRYRYEHPTPRHLIAAIREGVGDEAAATLSRTLFDAGWVDFMVQDVRSVPVRLPAGVFDGEKGRETKEPEEGAHHRWQSRVLVYRQGTLELPVDVELVLESGTRIRRRWDGRSRWTTVEHEGDERVVGAVVDPDVQITLDQNLLNNAVSESGGGHGRVLERLTYIAELALGGLGP